jgi:large subunit ribosomal protein L20
MVRVTNGFARHRKHKKFIKQATWFRLGRSNVYTQVRRALQKQWEHAYSGRKLKKRQFRSLWIERLNAVLRAKWNKYSVFVGNMAHKNIIINRKVLSNIAIVFPEVFDKMHEQIMS